MGLDTKKSQKCPKIYHQRANRGNKKASKTLEKKYILSFDL